MATLWTHMVQKFHVTSWGRMTTCTQIRVFSWLQDLAGPQLGPGTPLYPFKSVSLMMGSLPYLVILLEYSKTKSFAEVNFGCANTLEK